MPVLRPSGRAIALGALLLAPGLPPPIRAQVVTDGSLGPQVSLPGPDYDIEPALGQARGPNLFHSFSRLDVAAGESATFEAAAQTENILARVTGGGASSIDGTLRTLGGADPNLFLLNPAGLMFGPGARLEVAGAFVGSTASFVQMADGSRFVTTGPEGGGLTTAPPAAFGFLDPSPSGITIDGAELAAGGGQALSLLGGEITAGAGSRLSTAGGQIELVAVAGATTLLGNPADRPVQVPSGAALGEVELAPGSELHATDGGGIYIRGGRLVVDDAGVVSSTAGANAGGEIDLRVDDALAVRGRGTIRSESAGPGDGGAVTVVAGELRLEDLGTIGSVAAGSGAGGDVTVQSPSIVAANLGGLEPQVVGSITVTVPDMEAESGFEERELRFIERPGIQSTTLGPGAGGGVTLDLQGGELDIAASGMAGSASFGPGTGGDVTVREAETIALAAGGQVSAVTAGPGMGGDVDIDAGRLAADGTVPGNESFLNFTIPSNAEPLVGRQSAIAEIATGVDAITFAGGDTGSVEITVDRLELTHGATVEASTFGLGDGGGIDITAREALLLGGGGGQFTTGVFTSALSPDFERPDGSVTEAGDITIHTPLLEATGGGAIGATSFAGADAGSISIHAEDGRVRLSEVRSRSATGINSDALGATGEAGTITIHAETLEVLGAATVQSYTRGDGAAGDIEIHAADLRIDGSLTGEDGQGGIHAGTFGPGDGGGVTVTVDGDVEVLDGGTISAASFATGAGGVIDIDAGAITVRAEQVIGEPFLPFVVVQVTGDDTQLTGANDLLLIVEGPSINASSFSPAPGAGAAGRVDIDTGRLELTDTGVVVASTFGPGDGGIIDIDADEITISAPNTPRLATGIFTTGILSPPETGDTGAGGRAGDIRLTAGTLEVVDGGAIGAPTVRLGDGGDIEIEADRILVSDRGSGVPTGISTDAQALSGSGPEGTGDGGSITIRPRWGPGELLVLGNAVIQTSSTSDAVGLGGETASAGAAGTIDIETGTIRVDVEDQRGGIHAATFTTGAGGDVRLDAERVTLRGGNAVVAASISPSDAEAGTVAIAASDLRLERARVIASSNARLGGSIDVEATGSVAIIDQSRISASVDQQGMGSPEAGSITIRRPRVMALLGNSRIEADANRGAGGRVTIEAGALLRSPGSTITAEVPERLGVSGVVEIDSPEIDISSSLASLPAEFLDASGILPTPCAHRLPGEASTLAARTYEALPDSPLALRAYIPIDLPVPALGDPGAPPALAAWGGSPVGCHGPL